MLAQLDVMSYSSTVKYIKLTPRVLPGNTVVLEL